MRVLLVRHGAAMAPEEAAAAGLPDEARPLTTEGAQRLARATGALQAIEPQLSAVLASPLERARQSAQILARAYGLTAQNADLLRPGTPAAGLNAGLERFAGSSAPIALVGHEPDLGLLAGFWLCGLEARLLHFGKGAVGGFDFESAPAPAAGRLRYLIPEAVLRR